MNFSNTEKTMAALFNSLESSPFVAESKVNEESKELEKVEVGLRFRIDQIDAIDTGIYPYKRYLTLLEIPDLSI